MDDRLHTDIYVAANAQQAHLLRGMLAERGIEAFVENEPLQGASGQVPLGWTVAPRVVVAHKDAKKAREVALAFERQMEIGPPATDEPPAVETQWRDWPTCSSCGKLRQTVCPICS